MQYWSGYSKAKRPSNESPTQPVLRSLAGFFAVFSTHWANMAKNNPPKQELDLYQIARETMMDEGFQTEFPSSVDKELRRLAKSDFRPTSNIRDLRELLWSSIDNVTSRDLDQVEFVERLNSNEIRVLIGVADVDAFVQKGSAIDAHALTNTTSVYTGVATFPMLPEYLSTDKTSLIEAEDRLAIVIEFVVSTDGTSRTSGVFPALVHNYSKLSYEAVGEWLDENTSTPDEVSRVPRLEEQVRLQHEVSQRLRDARKRNGALQFETLQATPVMDEKGRVTDLCRRAQQRTRYHREFHGCS